MSALETVGDLLTNLNPEGETAVATAAAKPEIVDAAAIEESVGALVETTTANPLAVFTDEAQFDQFYTRLKAETDKHRPDVSTDKGRKAIASLAFKVTKAKTSLVAAGKGLTEEWRKKTALVNASRNKMEGDLNQLAADVRRPLTEWEQAEEARETTCKKIIEDLRQCVVLPFGAIAGDVLERLDMVEAMTFDPEVLQGYLPQATLLREQAIVTLRSQHDEIERAEKERAELEQLRAAAAEREAKEQAAREEAARIEAERIAAEQAAERDRLAKEAEAERIRQAEERAAQAARDAEAQRQRDEQEARQREHDAALAAERRRAEEAERAAQAERERIAAENAAQAARDADKAHRSQVMRAAKEAIMEIGGIDEPAAKLIVLAIQGGNVPNVSLRF